MAAVGRCVVTAVGLLVHRQVHQPGDQVGRTLRFADGSSARVYRQTTVEAPSVSESAGLVVEFRLRWVRGRGHAAFRAESLLNTPLFVGFPGFASKLWLTDDQQGRYRGLYEWDGIDQAHAYARALWWVLALVCERTSIHYVVIPGWTRSDLLNGGGERGDESDWWRVAP